ncbi:hypothetical protein [Mongoliibacter ruber]|uniref:Uncharacterized protein n=1 Tax=Mongoliibacter ruber TaxID=1750599 RepID=A0A2T0WSA9_9BACT|nr:hypothetical protein [Mongoliibacter ruber]PRY89589.1 hypothetical protein CLW00_10265 [Mongoliibacter ruber]
MNAKLNSQYVESYAVQYSQKICDSYFSQKKYMTGQEILQLTNSSQVNFFVIKTLFEAWQLELEKLKSNPYFDYRDKNVHEALKEFMNVLSRTIKIEKEYFEPLLAEAAAYSILLAVDPVAYFSEEFDKTPEQHLPNYIRENKKYFKWHSSLVNDLVDRAGLGYSVKAYKSAVAHNFEQQEENLESAESLLQGMNDILPLDFSKLRIGDELKKERSHDVLTPIEDVEVSKPKEVVVHQPDVKKEIIESDTKDVVKEVNVIETQAMKVASYKQTDSIDPLEAWARFENEEYSIMKGTIKELSESLGINQKIMFTKELFEGNPDLLKHALKSIDKCENFVDAIEVINQRYVSELNWDKDSEPVNEFLQVVFRKFDQRG